jgi:hypothetical protein
MMTDGFDSIIEGLEFDEPTDVVDVSKLDTIELIMLMKQLEEELLETGELLFPKTPEARSKHSLRNAAEVALVNKSR